MTNIAELGKGKPAKKAKSPALVGQIGKPPSKAPAFTLRIGAKEKKLPIEIITIYGRIGRLLGEQIKSELDIVRIVDIGLPSSALNRLIEEIDVDIGLIGPETTVRRRMQAKQRFTSVESERLVRLARITSMAEELFGDTKAASAWLSARAIYLPDAAPISPLELSATDSGARIVESMMLRTAHGVF